MGRWAGAQGAYGEGRGVSTREDLYKRTGRNTLCFSGGAGQWNGGSGAKDIGGWGEGQIKQEIDKKMLDAVLRENGEKKEKSQKNEKN